MNIRRTLLITALLLCSHTLFAQDAGTLKWSFATRRPIVASPALSPDESTLYVGSLDGNLYALDTESGDELWSIRLGAIGVAPVVTEDGSIYVGTKKGIFYAITEEGEIDWQFEARGPISGSPAVDENGMVYVASRDGRLYQLNPETHLKEWEFRATNDMTGTPMIYSTDSETTIFVAAGTTLYGISDSGTEVSSFTTGRPIKSTPAVNEEGTLYFGCNNEFIYAMESGGTTNDVLWALLTAADIRSSPAIGVDGQIYIGNDLKRLFSLNPDGSTKWKLLTRGPVRSAVSIGADGTIYVGADGKEFYAFTPEGERKWVFETKRANRSSAVIDSDGTVYFGSMDKMVYAVIDPVPSSESPWPMEGHDVQHTGRASAGEPVIIVQPNDATVNRGDTTNFTVVVSSPIPVTYQWLHNGTAIDSRTNSTATNATLVLTNIASGQAGSYRVRITSDSGELLSDEAQLTVRVGAVFIETQPMDRFVSTGMMVRLMVGVASDNGLENVSFQWQKNSNNIPGATNLYYEIANAMLSDSGVYTVNVTNAIGGTNVIGAATSQPAIVTVVELNLTRDTNDLIAAGNRFSAAIVTNALFTWGADTTGQLGDGGLTNRITPTRTHASNDWATISAGGLGFSPGSNLVAGHAVALRTSGLYGWGANGFGQLGTGPTNDQRLPVLVDGDTNWVQVEAGATHTVGLKRNGTIWAWGANDFGQLGLGTTISTNRPTMVGIDSGWVEVRAGGAVHAGTSRGRHHLGLGVATTPGSLASRLMSARQLRPMFLRRFRSGPVTNGPPSAQAWIIRRACRKTEHCGRGAETSGSPGT